MNLRRTGFLVGVVGLALSDGGMYLRMMTEEGAFGRGAAFWVGAIGALFGYGGWTVWLSAIAKARADAVGKGVLLDGLLLGISSASAFGVAVVLPQMRTTEAEIDQLWFLGCLVADAMLVWLALAVLITKPSSRQAWFTVVGIGLHVVVDILHTSVLGAPGWWQMRIAEGLLLMTFAMWLAAMHTSDVNDRAAEASRRVAELRTFGLVAALAGPGVLLASRLWGFRTDEAAVVGLVVLLLAGLTTLRIRGLVDDLTASTAALVHQAHHDHLTGVWNRTALADHLEGRDERDPIRAVIYLDLDGFKGVNDHFGHDAGDAVLVDVADRIRQAVRGSDRVARLGGDEFVVVVTDADTDVDAFIERLDRVLNRRPYRWDGETLDVGVSAGVARPVDNGHGHGHGQGRSHRDGAPGTASGADEQMFALLLAEADNAMLEAKKGRKLAAVAPRRS